MKYSPAPVKMVQMVFGMLMQTVINQHCGNTCWSMSGCHSISHLPFATYLVTYSDMSRAHDCQLRRLPRCGL